MQILENQGNRLLARLAQWQVALGVERTPASWITEGFDTRLFGLLASCAIIEQISENVGCGFPILRQLPNSQ
jgi:hypothetical protein